MINIFKRIYLNYDVDLRAGKTQKRIFVTNREFPHPITDDPTVRQNLGILQYYRSVEQFLTDAGGLAGALKALYDSDEKVCFIAKPEFVTLLQLCVFKSLMKNPTVDAAYLFYKSSHMHQRASSMQTLTNYENDAMYKGSFPALLGLEEFTKLYDEAVVCGFLQDIAPEDIPFEYLLADSLSPETRNPSYKFSFLRKYRAIALENAIFRIRVLRNEILAGASSSAARMDMDVDELDVMDELIKNNATSWLADEDLALYSEASVIQKYSVYQLLEIYDSIEKVLGISIEERRVLEYIARNEIAELVGEDMKDQRGNFIGTESFVSKINGVFINKCYREWFLNNMEFFKQFTLISK